MIINSHNISPVEILRTLGLRFRDYRMCLDLTRKEISDMTAVSMTTLYKFETGTMTDMSAVTLFKLLNAIGLPLNHDNLIPDLPESPYLYTNDKKRQRIRHPRS